MTRLTTNSPHQREFLGSPRASITTRSDSGHHPRRLIRYPSPSLSRKSRFVLQICKVLQNLPPETARARSIRRGLSLGARGPGASPPLDHHHEFSTTFTFTLLKSQYFPVALFFVNTFSFLAHILSQSCTSARHFYPTLILDFPATMAPRRSTRKSAAGVANGNNVSGTTSVQAASMYQAHIFSLCSRHCKLIG